MQRDYFFQDRNRNNQHCNDTMVAMTMEEKHTPYPKKGVFTHNSMGTTRVPQLGKQTKSQHYSTKGKQELTISFTDALSMLGTCATATWLPFSSTHNLETDSATMMDTHTRTEDQNQDVSDDRGPVTKRECTRPPYQHHTSPLQKKCHRMPTLGPNEIKCPRLEFFTVAPLLHQTV